MKNYNSTDFNPHRVTIPSSDFFSFLDNEYYYIGALEDSSCDKFIRLNKESGIMTFDSFRQTAYQFRWKGNGYAICDAENPSFVLTLQFSRENSKYYVSMDRYQNRPEQIWDVIPYNAGQSGYGISIRSSIMISGDYLYMGCSSYLITLSPDREKNTRFLLCSLSDWVTFGQACMQFLNWIYVTDSDVTKSLTNYYTNIGINLAPESTLLLDSTGVIVNQSGGNFKKLHYSDVFMDEVACEAIAVCNALRINSYGLDPSNHDFFKLVVEFELSGLYKNNFKKLIVSAGSALGISELSSVSTKEGAWGGDPDRIGSCLEAHNASFKMIHIKDQSGFGAKNKKSEAALKLVDEEILKSSCAVVSYNFYKFHQAIHTFTCMPYESSIRAFNRYCEHTLSRNYLNLETDNKNRGFYRSVSHAVTDTSDARFYVAYLIQKP